MFFVNEYDDEKFNGCGHEYSCGPVFVCLVRVRWFIRFIWDVGSLHNEMSSSGKDFSNMLKTCHLDYLKICQNYLSFLFTAKYVFFRVRNCRLFPYPTL